MRMRTPGALLGLPLFGLLLGSCLWGKSPARQLRTQADCPLLPWCGWQEEKINRPKVCVGDRCHGRKYTDRVGTGSEREVLASRLPFLAGSDGLDPESQHVTGRGRAAQVRSSLVTVSPRLVWVTSDLASETDCFATAP